MADVARGGMNQAVIAIEEARGRLSAAADAPRRVMRPLHWPASPRPSPRPTAPIAEDPRPCSCVSRPISHGMSPPTSWRSRSSASSRFDGPLARARPPHRRRAARARRLRRAVREALRGRPWPPPASCRSGASCWPRRGRCRRRSTARPSTGSGRTIERRLGGRTVRAPGRLDRRPRRPGSTADADGRRRAAGRAGIVEGHYEPKAHLPRRRSRRRRRCSTSSILVVPGGDATALAAAAERGRIIGEGANTARTLANRAVERRQPGGPRRRGQRPSPSSNGLWIDVIAPDKAAELGMGMFMAVGRGSDNPPRMIVMRSGKAGRDGRARPPPGDRRQGRLLRLRRHLDQAVRPDGRDEDGQDRRRTVIAAIETVARLAPGTPLLAIAPAVENMPGPHSTRPGRRRQGAQRQDGRHHEHRRRGPADPRRRDDLRRAARARPTSSTSRP